MARVAGVDIPDQKRVEIALTRVYGIGRTRARQLTERAGLEGNPRVQDLNEGQLNLLRTLIDGDYMVEGDLRREVNDNIRRLIDIGTYRGLRHRRGLPLRGQRTRTNARTRRGSRRAVVGKRRVASKK
jgi:small subunit ribosomal protein S13